MKESEFFLEISRGFALAEKTGCNKVLKFSGEIIDIRSCSFSKEFREKNYYEVALHVIDGRAAFIGDHVWHPSHDRPQVLVIPVTKNPELLSWNPPKPKTVMVELLIDDVNVYVNKEIEAFKDATARANRVRAAFAKALEDQK